MKIVYIQLIDTKSDPIQGISVFQDLLKEPGALLCFDFAGLQMAVCISSFRQWNSMRKAVTASWCDSS